MVGIAQRTCIGRCTGLSARALAGALELLLLRSASRKLLLLRSAFRAYLPYVAVLRHGSVGLMRVDAGELGCSVRHCCCCCCVNLKRKNNKKTSSRRALGMVGNLLKIFVIFFVDFVVSEASKQQIDTRQR